MLYSVVIAMLSFCAAAAMAQTAAPMMMRPVVNNVEVACQPDQMLVTISTEGPFTGKVYPKGFFKRDECVQTFSNQPTPFTMSLNFSQVQTCGMVMEDRDQQTAFTSVVVIQPHSKLVTMMAKAYQVRCTYDYRGSRLTENGFTGLVTDALNVSMLGTVWEDGPGLSLRLLDGGIGQADGTAAPPTAKMEIYFADRSRIAERVNLGDLLEMRISLAARNARDVFGIYVRGCTVADGMGMDSQRLLNENGCSVDPMVFPHFSYTEQQSTAIALFKAHKFPYTSEVQYVCYVDFCLKLNNGCKDFQDRAGLLDSGVCPAGLPRESRILSAIVTQRDSNAQNPPAVSADQEASIPVHGSLGSSAVISTNPGQPGIVTINGQQINTGTQAGRITIQIPSRTAPGGRETVTIVQPGNGGTPTVEQAGQQQQQPVAAAQPGRLTIVETSTVAPVNAGDLELIRQLQAAREAQRARDQQQLLAQLQQLRQQQSSTDAPASSAAPAAAGGNGGVNLIVANNQQPPLRFTNVTDVQFQSNPNGGSTTVRETVLPGDAAAANRQKRSLFRSKRQAIEASEPHSARAVQVSDASSNRASPDPITIRRALYVIDTEGLSGAPSNDTRRAGLVLGQARDLSFEPHLPVACNGMEGATYLFVIIIVLGGALLMTIAVLVFVLIRMAMRRK